MVIAINLLRPTPKIDLGLATAKLLFLKTHPQDYQIIFLGSSRTHRMIDSKAIEGQLLDKGCTLRVFNMGFANLTLEESDYLLEEILSIPDHNFQLIILDEPLTGLQYLDQARSKRTQMLRGFKYLTRRFENIYSYQEPLSKKIYRTGVALYGFAYGILNIGAMSEKLFPETYLSTRQEEDVLIDREQKTFSSLGGFKILEDTLDQDERAQRVHTNFLAQKEEFETLLKRRDMSPSPFPAHKRAPLLKEQFKKIQAHHITTGFYVAPLPHRRRENKALVEALGIETFVLNYNDPMRFPIIWQSKYWFDPYHLNREGARLMSQDIGRTLSKTVCLRYAHRGVF